MRLHFRIKMKQGVIRPSQIEHPRQPSALPCDLNLTLARHGIRQEMIPIRAAPCLVHKSVFKNDQL